MKDIFNPEVVWCAHCGTKVYSLLDAMYDFCNKECEMIFKEERAVYGSHKIANPKTELPKTSVLGFTKGNE